jgi:hypothetical protein
MKDLNVTTYLVVCPETIRASDCGILGDGITVIAGPTFAEIRQANNLNK